MGAILYYLMTFAEAGLGVFGFRGLYEQPHYTVVERLASGVEIRDYAPRVAVETDSSGDGAAAFSRLFRYITGSNATGARIAMTAPVAQGSELIGKTLPVERSGESGAMRFFLPREIAAQGAPVPLDPSVRIVEVPAERVAVLRFSGIPHRTSVDAYEKKLLSVVSGAGLQASGEPSLLTYDAPFTIPFLRRNEVAVDVVPPISTTRP